MTDWLLANRMYTLLAIPLLAFAEACIGIGLFVSGIILFSIAALLYNSGLISLAQIAMLSFPGALLGDQLGFFAGSRLGPGIHQTRLGQRYSARLQRTEQMITRHAGGAVFIGRFIPAIRSLIPAMLGISGFDRRRYLMLDAAACALWSIALAALVSLSSILM
ncbi:MAG: VTT domain-containing protein [Pseudohongiella sp.]|nr:VTT domain-containing protein [Pseudohongiella sp.]MDP2126455.1 VTT domain-containing protein [Pseudohongiella sp.]